MKIKLVFIVLCLLAVFNCANRNDQQKYFWQADTVNIIKIDADRELIRQYFVIEEIDFNGHDAGGRLIGRNRDGSLAELVNLNREVVDKWIVKVINSFFENNGYPLLASLYWSRFAIDNERKPGFVISIRIRE